MSQNSFIILPLARKDLRGIGEFLGEDSRDKTMKLFGAVREAVNRGQSSGAICSKIRGMSIVQLEMPDNLWQFVSKSARAQGYEDNAAYLLAVVEKMAQRQQSLYPHDDNPTPEQLERQKQLLLESSEGEPEVVDDAWWNELHQEVTADVAARKNGATKGAA